MSDTKALIKYVRDRLNDGPNITFGKPTVRDMVGPRTGRGSRREGRKKSWLVLMRKLPSCVMSLKILAARKRMLPMFCVR